MSNTNEIDQYIVIETWLGPNQVWNTQGFFDNPKAAWEFKDSLEKQYQESRFIVEYQRIEA